MADTNVVKAESRTECGSAESRRMRHGGQIPAVMYAEGKQAELLKLDRHELEQTLRHHASEQVVMDLDVPSQGVRKVLLKEVQHHPLTGALLHVDFLAISMDQTLRIGIAVNLVGQPIGVQQDGGVLEQHLREIEVECLPGDIVESIDYDVTNLEVNDSVSVSDLQCGSDRVKVLTDGSISVANVVRPRVAVEDDAEEAEDEALEEGAAEPEVISDRRAEEEGGASGD